jgi:hypothetical protein
MVKQSPVQDAQIQTQPPHALYMAAYARCAAAPLALQTHLTECRHSADVSAHAVPAAGYFKNRFGAVFPCHAGTFKPAKGVSGCSRCKGRTYAPRAGQKTCSQVCPRGCRVNPAHTACISYPPGTQPGPGNARRPCPAGELPIHINHCEVARPMLRWLC